MFPSELWCRHGSDGFLPKTLCGKVGVGNSVCRSIHSVLLSTDHLREFSFLVGMSQVKSGLISS